MENVKMKITKILVFSILFLLLCGCGNTLKTEVLKDIPYYNGYYTKIGEPLVVAYKGYPHIKVDYNSAGDIWVDAKLNESSNA